MVKKRDMNAAFILLFRKDESKDRMSEEVQSFSNV